MEANGYTFNTLANWKRTLRKYPYLQKPKYILKLIYLASTGVITAPFQWHEKKHYSEIIRNTQPNENPILIMGFWRTGTTHLHNLLIQDRRYAYLSNLHGLMPGSIVSGEKILRPLMQLLFPKTRPMDNIAITPYAPQEEDIAMMNISPHAYYHYVLFPSQIRPLFKKYVLMQGISPAEREEWREDYMYILRSLTYTSKGKPIIFKNPPNIARLPEITQLFPKAKYIEIRRNPLSVWISFLHLHKTTIPTHNIEDLSWEQLEEDALYIFEKTMRKWLSEKDLIPEENKVIISYENLVESPLETMQYIYKELNLDDKKVYPLWDDYLKSIKGYQGNNLSPRAKDIEYMRKKMAFLYEAWDYPLPEIK